MTYIVEERPDIICFTSYLWNVERNLYLAELLKKYINSIIIFGGPEITSGSMVFKKYNPFVDIFVSGEGEWFFNLYITGKQIDYHTYNKNKIAIQPPDNLIKPEDIVEPLTAGYLNSLPDGSVFIELTRGCPYRCIYCYYSKNYYKVRELSFNHLVSVIKNKPDISEIYIISPTFDMSNDFIQKLNTLNKLKHNVSLHTEMRADRITAEIAKLIYDAGFRSLEIGLQTLNAKSLKIIRRNSNPEKELAGLLYLKNSNIELKIGIIPGLPEDTPSSFLKTVDTLIDCDFTNSIELYPLMLLPGTALRDHADKDVINYQKKPPYFFLEGWNFKFDDLINITSYLELKTGMSNRLFYLPDFSNHEQFLFVKGIRFNGDILPWPVNDIHTIVQTSVIDLHIYLTDGKNFYTGLKSLAKSIEPDRLYNLIIHSDELFSEEIIIKILVNFEKDNFYRRLHIFDPFIDGSVIHLFQVTEKIEIYEQINDIIITPILRLTTDTSVDLTSYCHKNEISLLIADGLYNKFSDILIKLYKNNYESITFENHNDMKQFYTHININSIQLPFNFGIISH